MRKAWLGAAVVGCALSIGPLTPLQAADHIDAPATTADPTADITDLYAWMSSDASKLNLILDVTPFAGANPQFSDAVTYVFHVNSSAGYGMAQTETQVICQFYDVSKIECWAGSEYVEGDPSAEAGITSSSGKMKVFAGPRNDPFFMEFTGFTETVKAVIAASPLPADANGCPTLDSTTGAALRSQLMSGMSGAAASDTFAGENVLSIVVQIDKDVVNSGGSVLSVWASTHAAN